MPIRFKLELVSEQGNPKVASAVAAESEGETLEQATARVKQVMRKIYDNHRNNPSTDEEFNSALIQENV